MLKIKLMIRLQFINLFTSQANLFLTKIRPLAQTYPQLSCGGFCFIAVRKNGIGDFLAGIMQHDRYRYMYRPDYSWSPPPLIEDESARIGRAFRWADIDTADNDPDHFLAIRPLEGNGRQWLQDLRIIESLSFIDKHCGKATRRYGPAIPETAHLIWVAHRMFNNEQVRAALTTGGINPALAAFLGLHHDTIEAMRSIAAKRGNLFKKQATIKKVCSLWTKSDDKDHAIIRAVLAYITDDDPALSGLPRIEAQKNKSIRPSPSINSATDDIIAVLCVQLREADKSCNLGMDAIWRQHFVQAGHKGKIPAHATREEIRRFGIPDDEITDAWKQGQMKAYAVERDGISEQANRRYFKTLEYLEKEAAHVAVKLMIRQCAEAMFTPFTVGVSIMLRIITRAESAIRLTLS